MMSWITQGLDQLVPQPPGPQPEQQPEVGPQVLLEVLMKESSHSDGDCCVCDALLQVLVPAAASGEAQVHQRSLQETLPQSGVSAEAQLLPVKTGSDPEDRTDSRPLPPTYVCVCVGNSLKLKLGWMKLHVLRLQRSSVAAHPAADLDPLAQTSVRRAAARRHFLSWKVCLCD